MQPAKKDPYDKTSTKRQIAHLKRLANKNGKRITIDLDGEHLKKIEALLQAKYGASTSHVIRNAINDIYQIIFDK
ncbi:hypothetical protein [Noviherbaspirillum sp.]|uniref:hypothetical protein n=1 Tax=Noviherbaspirillum sp. TaxID=1926288 RepID=UPI002FDF0AC4